MKNWPTRHNHGMTSGPCPSIQQPQPHIPPILLHFPPETTHQEPDMGSSSLLSDKGWCPRGRQIMFSTTIVECISFCLTCNVSPGSIQPALWIASISPQAWEYLRGRWKSHTLIGHTGYRGDNQAVTPHTSLRLIVGWHQLLIVDCHCLLDRWLLPMQLTNRWLTWLPILGFVHLNLRYKPTCLLTWTSSLNL